MDSRRADALLALGVLTGIVAGTYGELSYSGPGERPLDALGLVLIFMASAALAFRRGAPPALAFRGGAPVAVAVVTGVCAVGYYGLRYPGVFALAPALISLYTVASLGRRRAAIGLAAALGAGVYGFVALSTRDPAPGDGVNLLSGWLVAMVVAGDVAGNRRAYLREVERRAEEAERTREEAALRRAGEERLWIAQEMHDTLTHAISVVNVQAAVASELLDRDPERARAALVAVRESGQEAMRELRATLGVLRQADPDGPEAGLARLGRLVSRAEAAGLPVESRVVGDPRPLPPEVDRAAYRIAQEAFTNVLRHAGATSITLTTEYHPAALVLRVEDEGEPLGHGDAGEPLGDEDNREPSGHGDDCEPLGDAVEPGMGLIGMRERAVALGGSFTAGPRGRGGFAVRAELPLARRP
ncbi:histidine kinase [Sphaerisporangium sp. TRM90804]|uniref:sensor histidine kinase n=1 Tax=Sphaerisporangium sp. TRM90804 TaxID=3031113 RepID=UPI00244D4F92|nr:histidine kinase [Sphaerisporangium sp. TRM90804]MDH2430714.1 histidine kinase [Sphaerisporangium sp. TRM90804]